MWPQIVMLTLYALALLRDAMYHGEVEKPKERNFYKTVFLSAIVLFILYMGGFFDSILK